jgi:Peptidase family S41
MLSCAVMPPVHRREILLEEFLTPLGVSQYQLAKAVDVPRQLSAFSFIMRPKSDQHGYRAFVATGSALTSTTTFSGAEQLSYDLQQLGRARIIGERTAAAPTHARDSPYISTWKRPSPSPKRSTRQPAATAMADLLRLV